ncbi:MAG: hypothetical protein M1818_005736 [Claussenomyces sp. TS43310]|nr:MAG: hypothetical protein M1818_005736 [Claussenomyces sp. TS43310]
MVKILKTMLPKHKETLSPLVEDFVQEAATITLPLLPQQLAKFPSRWPFPRGDLYHWIPLLNRFDDALEMFCTVYGLHDGPQIRDFACELLDKDKTVPESLYDLGFKEDGDRELIESILDFSRMLLENCGNRSIYASSPFLSDLLNSTSLSLIASTLQIGTQLAQRYQASFKRMAAPHRHASAALLSNHYNIDLDRVQQLATPFARTTMSPEPALPTTPLTPSVKGKDKAYFNIPHSASKASISTVYASDLVSLARGKSSVGGSPSSLPTEVNWDDWGEVRITYYESRKVDNQPSTSQSPAIASAQGQAPATPTPVRRTSNLGQQSGQRSGKAATSDESPVPSRSNTYHSDDGQASSSLRVVEIPKSQILTNSIHQILTETLPKLPKEMHYELLTKIRVAKAFASSVNSRQQILAVRVLAITNLAYIHAEPTFLEKVLKQDSDEPRRLQVIYQLAELVHPPADGEVGIPRSLQTIALSGLEALAQHQTKYQDICAALNTNVNHGILLYIVRKAVAEMRVDEISEFRSECDDWRGALFSLLSHISNLPRAGSELVTAGLIQILVEVLSMRTTVAERNYPKVINFLDNIVFSTRDAFQILVNAEGLDTISDLVVHEVMSASASVLAGQGMTPECRSPSIDYDIPFFQQQSIKWLFKFIHHMMSSATGFSGNFDRLLRNLIDSSKFLGSLREIISHSRRFGSSVWTNSVGILNDFINNEPTSFSVIAEAGLSRAFLEAVTGKEIKMAEGVKDGHIAHDHSGEGAEAHSHEDDESLVSAAPDDVPNPTTSEVLQTTRSWRLAQGILPSSETIIAIPQTFGAICLNSSGMRMFQVSTALQSFFEIFESPDHVRCMENDPNLPMNLGQTFDELVRHHPTLKTGIRNATLNMVARVAHLCQSKEFSDRDGAHLWTTLASGETVAVSHDLLPGQVAVKGKGKAENMDEDIEMSGMKGDGAGTEGQEVRTEGATKPSTTAYIYAASCFLSTIFSNASVRIGFMERGGIEYVLDLAELPSLPEHFADDRSRDMLHKVIALLAEQKPHLVMPSLVKRTQSAVDALIPLTHHRDSTPYFGAFITNEVRFPADDLAAANIVVNDARLVKALVRLQSLTTALNQCSGLQVFSHRTSAAPFNQVNLADYYIKLINSLGSLLGATVRETLKLQKGMPERWQRAMPIKDLHAFGSSIDDETLLLLSQVPKMGETEPSSSSGQPTSDVTVPDNIQFHGSDSQTITMSERESASFKNLQTLRALLSKIVPTVTPLFQAIGKALIPNKRNVDAFQRQSHLMIADALASAILKQLEPFGGEMTTDNFKYWNVLLSTVRETLVNVSRHTDRPPFECITIVLQVFKERDGFKCLNHLLQAFTEQIRAILPLGSTESPARDTLDGVNLGLAALGTKKILNLYLLLVNGKNVAEATQSAILGSRSSGDRTRPEFFSPGQFLVEVRMAILPVVRQLWESDLVETDIHKISKQLIEILRTVALADHEGGSYKRVDKVVAPSKASRKSWKPLPDNLVRLIEAGRQGGYDEDLAKEGLFRCNNNLAYAMEYCRAQLVDHANGRNPVPQNDIDYSADAEQSSKAPTRPSTGSATPDGNLMVLDEAATHPPATSNGDMGPPPIPMSHQMLDDPMTVSLDNLLSGLSRTLEASTAAPSSTVGEGHQLHATPESPSQQSIGAGGEPNTITIDDLNEERAAIRERLIDRCLDVINSHGEITFEVSDLITTVVNKSPDPASMRKEMGETLVNALMSFGLEDDVRPVGTKVAAYAHLLALMLQDKAFYGACVGELKENLLGLLGFVKFSTTHSSEESSPWISHVLLIVETLLSEDAQPLETRWKIPTSESDAVDKPVLKLVESVISVERRAILFEAILEILPRIGKDGSLALAISRVLVILTRTRSIAQSMGEKKNIQRLFVMAKQLAATTSARLQSHMMLILRHIIEDDDTMKQIMRAEIKAFFDSPRTQRHVDVKSYLQSLSNLVIRAPKLFVEVSNEMIKLAKWSSSIADSPGRQQITLQESYTRLGRNEAGAMVLPAVQATEGLSMDDVKPSTEEVVDDSTEKQKPTHVELKPPVVENPDGVIHFLLSELLNYRDVEDKDAPPQPTDNSPESSGHGNAAATDPRPASGASAPAEAKDSKRSAKHEFKAEEHPIYVYRCFLLQCLTELLSCYNRTKIEFINFKRNSALQAMTPSKPRSSVVNYLLFDLIPVGTLEHAETVALRKRLATSNWADSVLTALLSKTGEQILDRSRDPMDLEDEPDLQYVRKFVLENILKAYREASGSNEALDVKYARMLSLADLMSHIMTGKDHHGGGSDAHVPKASTQQLRRIMFEKGYIAALTGSIADIDLNFPGAKRAVKYILRPLKVLTQIAIDLSDEGKISAPPGQGDDDEIASATSVSEIENEREETPDLFRNSTLGMFEPGRDHESSSESDDDDEEMYEGYDDEEMEYDEEMEDDNEDDISDEDEDIEGMGPIEGLSGDHGVDVEVIMEEEGSDDGDEDEDDDSQEDDDDESDDMDDEGHDHGHVEIIDEHGNVLHAEGEDDDEWQSDEEEEEIDYEGRDPDDEEALAHPLDHITHGPLGHLVRALGGDDHEGAVEILQRIEDDGMNQDEQMELEGYLHDPQEEDEDEDDDDEDTDEDEDIFDEYPNPLPGMPFGWDEEVGQPIVISRHGRPRQVIPSPFPFFPGGPRGDPLGVPDFRGSTYRSHRPGPTTRGNDDGTNPLLQRPPNIVRDDRPRIGPGASLAPLRSEEGLMDMSGLGRGPFGEGSGIAFLNEMITSLPISPGSIARHGGSLHFHVTGGPRGEMSREIQAMFGTGRSFPFDFRRRESPESGNVSTFVPQTTATRWMEEAKLLFGLTHAEKATRIIIGLLAVIVPPALELEVETKKIAVELARKRAEEERLAREKREAEEKAAKEKEASERAAAEAEAAAAAAAAATTAADSSVAQGADPEAEEKAGEAMDGVEATAPNSTQEAVAESNQAASQPRVLMSIRGNDVDITDLGIDADFLNELPEDIREEVIATAIAERRSQAAATGAPPSDIDQEFLDALPAEIREEIIQQERQDRRRREREETRRQAAQNGAVPPPAVAQEMDAASILATLPPDLRRQIIMEQDDDILAQLPPEYAREARAGRPEHPTLSQMRRGTGNPALHAAIQDDDQPQQKPARRSIVQMLDKSGVATLLRLMFVFQQGSLRITLFQVLQNVSENRHSRAEVISTLLHILQDGSADMSAVERSFAHLSLRAKQPKEKEPRTPQPLKRSLTGSAPNFVTNAEVSPLLVVQQCLSALVYLSQINLHVPSFFLTEHDSGTSLKRNTSRKGKAKETKASKYALNSLLSLLDRKLIMESSSVMESLSDLLSRITAPLQALERKQKGAIEDAKKTDLLPSSASGAPVTSLAETSTSEQLTGPTNTEATVEGANDVVAVSIAAEDSTASVTAGGSSELAETKLGENKKLRPFVAPVIPEANLKLVINIFIARECSAKTFRETLSTVKNLSCIPGAKEVFGRELIRKAQELGEIILVDLDQLLPQIQKASTGTEIQGVALAKFSPSGSDQNKLLRVLTALDHLFDPKHNPKKSNEGESTTDGGSSKNSERQDLLATLYENSTFGPMWEKLSTCLSAIRQREHMLNVATILLPLIEALMVVCKNTTLKDTSRSQLNKEMALASPPPESRMENLFFTFTEEHRKILNDLVRHTPKLMSGTFSLLVKNPKVLEFDNKRNYFTRSIHNRNNQTRQNYPPLQLSVRRDQVFHDSFKSLFFKGGDEMKFGKLSIRFHGEEGVDAGGVTREWFQVLARQMFDPGYALFIPVSSDRTTFHPNHLSSINPEHLSFFKFIGRIIGKALYEGRVLDCHFSRAVYKRILGKSVSIKDMESLDPEYYKSVVWMLENDITDIITETFSVDDDQFGVVNTVDLIPNGRNIPVTQENKHEYVRLMVEFKLTGSVQEQLDNFLKGFHEIIPAELVAIFNEQELELLISGLPEIDVDDWKNNTEYHQYTASSPQIQWFWRAIRSFDKEERAKMLQFVTGTSKVPLNGFKELEGMNGFSRFNIHRDYGNKDRLPTSHTCFNQLDLPEYENYETLRQQVLMAITAGSEYFGFA